MRNVSWRRGSDVERWFGVKADEAETEKCKEPRGGRVSSVRAG